MPLFLQAQGSRPRPEQFRYQRLIHPAAQGPNRLAVDVPLLSGAAPFERFLRESNANAEFQTVFAQGGMSDFRIYDSANHEIPYLLIDPPSAEPKWIFGTTAAMAATKKSSGFEADFGKAAVTDCLRITGIPAPFLKRFCLEGSGDRSRWTVLIPDGTLFDLPAENLKRLEIEFLPGEFRYLRITWDDSTSARVQSFGTVAARLVSSEARAPQLRVPIQFERRASEPGVSRYRLQLPAAHLPIIGIELVSPVENILRPARVVEGRLSGNEVTPFSLGSSTLRRATRGEINAADLCIPIEVPNEAQLELVIDDGDNPPLAITEIRALYASLPLIYFDAPGTEPLTARYGYAGLQAPQYDLEALRGSVKNIRVAEARWEEKAEKRVMAETPLDELAPQAGAPIDPRSFDYAREIPAGEPGLNALTLDAAVLAHSNLSDLRIAGEDNKQVPYLLEKMEEPLSSDLPALQKTRPPAGEQSVNQSWYHLPMPYADLRSARLVLNTSARVFKRNVSLVEIEKERGRKRYFANREWNHISPDYPAQALTLELPNANEFMLVVDEGDNSPLPITSAKLLLPRYRVRFFRPAGKLTLYYGNEKLDAPQYDLALLAPRLVGAPVAEIAALHPESQVDSAQKQNAKIETKVFWIILIVAVVILLALVFRLSRPVNRSDEDV
jgi:hypothetical protein